MDTRDTTVRVRIRQKDIKEREAMNSENHQLPLSASSEGDALRLMRSGVSIGDTDREPGELSSESGSDEPTESIPQSSDIKVLKVENGNLPPYEKKRKFQPIVWDRDDKAVSRKPLNASKEIVLPPPPPLLPSTNHVSQEVARDFPIKDGKVQNKEVLPVMALFPHEPNGNYAAKSPAELSDLVSVEKRWGNDEEAEQLEEEDSVPTRHIGSSRWGNDEEAEQLEEEDSVPTRHIGSSRWADDFKSPRDEGEFFEDQGTRNRRKRKFLSESLDATVHIKSQSPDDVEHNREGSDGAKVQSSESDEKGARARPSIRYDYSDNVSDDYNSMDIDLEYENVDTGSSESANDSEGETHSDKTPEPEITPQRSINMLQGCRSVDEFDRLNKIDEGTYGVVYRAKDKKTGEIVALKKVKMEREKEGFPLTSLREINILLSFHHQSIVDVKEVVVGSNLDSIFMVMEYMEHDLKGLMETMKQPYSQSEVKCLMLQLLEGTKYLHDNWVLHRDLKTSNLLLNNRGELKICDFGLSRQYGSPLKPYTHLVVTLWYRAPELLLGAKQYSTAIDMWSLGCIMAELLTKEPLFNGRNDVDQLDKIFRTLGTPNETIWPGFSKLPGLKVNFVKHQYNMLRKKFPATSFTGSPVLSESGFDLLNQLLTYDPEKRITAEAALNHEWFREVPLPKSKDFMPTFPAQHAQDRRTRRILKSPDPLAEQRRKELQQGELGTCGLFGGQLTLVEKHVFIKLSLIDRSFADYHCSPAFAVNILQASCCFLHIKLVGVKRMGHNIAFVDGNLTESIMQRRSRTNLLASGKFRRYSSRSYDEFLCQGINVRKLTFAPRTDHHDSFSMDAVKNRVSASHVGTWFIAFLKLFKGVKVRWLRSIDMLHIYHHPI